MQAIVKDLKRAQRIGIYNKLVKTNPKLKLNDYRVPWVERLDLSKQNSLCCSIVLMPKAAETRVELEAAEFDNDIQREVILYQRPLIPAVW